MSYFPKGLGTLPEGLSKSTAGAHGMTRSSTGVTQSIWAFSRSTARVWPSQNGNRGPLHCPPLDIRLFSLLFHVSDCSDCAVLSHPPLVCFPSWHRGKCGVHCFRERSWNGCMLIFGSCMGGLITLSLKLKVCCWLQRFLFGCFLSHFPMFFLILERQHVRLYRFHMGVSAASRSPSCVAPIVALTVLCSLP